MSKNLFNIISITPHSFSKENLQNRNFEKITNFLSNLTTNGTIVFFSDDWKDLLIENIKELEQEDFDDIKSLLNTLFSRNRMILNKQASFSSENEEELMRKTNELHKIKNFDLLIGINEYPNFIKIEELKREVLRYEGAIVDKQTRDNLKNIFINILHYAEIVKIIDPYFNFEPVAGDKTRYMDTIHIICENTSVRHNNNLPAIIEIHTSVKSILNNDKIIDWKFVQNWESIINDLEKKYNHKIEVNIWEEDKSKDEWHERYIITDQCALSIGKGTDISDFTDSTWSLLNWDDIDKTASKYIENRNIYKLIAKVNSSGLKKINKSNNYDEYKTEEEIAEKKANVKNFKKVSIPQKKS